MGKSSGGRKRVHIDEEAARVRDYMDALRARTPQAAEPPPRQPPQPPSQPRTPTVTTWYDLGRRLLSPDADAQLDLLVSLGALLLQNDELNDCVQARIRTAPLYMALTPTLRSAQHPHKEVAQRLELGQAKRLLAACRSLADARDFPVKDVCFLPRRAREIPRIGYVAHDSYLREEAVRLASLQERLLPDTGGQYKPPSILSIDVVDYLAPRRHESAQLGKRVGELLLQTAQDAYPINTQFALGPLEIIDRARTVQRVLPAPK